MKYLILVSLMLASSAAVSAPSPEMVASQYGAAIVKQDWHTAVGFFRADDLKRIRSAFSKQMQKPGGDGVRAAFFGEMSTAEIAKLTDLTFCEKIFFGYFSTMAAKGTELQVKEYSILGVVPDGQSIAYVVTKQKGFVGGVESESVDALATVRDSGEWYLALPKQFETVIAMWEEH